MFVKKLFKMLFGKKIVVKEVLKEERVVVKEEIVVEEILKPYKKEEIDLNNIDFHICPRFQIFLDMVRNE